ncbi:MAG TPA: mobile mystery protein B [bacterium]|nr:mobile mystery protein B [bacterium]
MARNLNVRQEDGQTPIDDISGLKLNITTQGELNRAEYENYRKANQKYRLEKITSKLAPFTFDWLCQLHSEILGDVWAWAGEIRKSEKTIGFLHHKIGSGIHQLLYELGQWEKEKIQASEIAVRLHFRLVTIHPFENGNGRWARLATNIYLRKNGLHFINWPAQTDEIKTFRPDYIEALRQAEKENLDPLRSLHAKYSSV